MEHQEDNARFENYLENRLAESLQISGVAGENQHQANLAASELPASADIASSKSDQRDEDDEWKYIHEVQQSEKLQQQKHQTRDAGNGYSSHPEDLIVGIGNGASAGFVYEEEDVEVIKNDGDFSTNSNTTTSTGEVAPKGEHTFEETEEVSKQQHQKPQSPDVGQEEEDEQSSVATTYGTSSLSENNPTPLDEVVPVSPLTAQNIDSFDGKENVEPVEQEDNYSQLNPNAVVFVPSFGSQPASPLPAADVPVFGLNHRQILGGPLDDLVAESPRKGSAKDNMDAIAVPDEREFDIEADKRPHELEQDSDVFGEGNLEEQLLNGVGSSNPSEPTNVIDHGPETSVDLDLSLDQAATGDGDIMKHSFYGEQNTSIEDILNSVQPLPTQPGDELVEKEFLNIEVKELVSKSPSTEELQFQEEINHGFDLQQPLYQKPLGGTADEDPMQASFYLENTSSEAQNQETETELPVERRDPFAEESFLLDTSAPQLTAQSNEPMANFELNSQLADIVDITPSPLSLTEEKHLVENTKEMVGDDLLKVEIRPEETEHLDHGFKTVGAPEYELEQPTETVAGVDLGFAKEDDPEPKFYLESNVVEPVSAGAPPQEESYAAPNAASGNIAQHEDALSPAAQGINPFAQPFTPAYAHFSHKELDEIAPQEESNIVEESQPLNADAPKYDELQLQEELVEEEFAVNPSFASTNLDLGEKIVSESLENKVELQTAVGEPLASTSSVADNFFNSTSVLPATTDAEPPLVGLEKEKIFDGEDLEGLVPVKPEPIVSEEKLSTEGEVGFPSSEPGSETNKIQEEVKAAISTPLAETNIKAKPISVDSKKPTTKTVAKPKTSASLPTAKKDTAAVPPSGATKVAAARPRTAPAAAKTTIGVTKPSSAGVTTATRKPLTSNAGPNAKGLPKTTLTSTRPSTAPISKPNLAAKTTANKQGGNASTTGGSLSVSGARAPARTRPLTSAPKSATNATSAEDGTNSLTRKVASANATGSKPRVMVVPPATAKPKVSPPRSATSALRKATTTNGTLMSARSPTKPTSNGTGKTSTTTITSSTTITKTFTARPAPKSTHSTSSTTTSQGSALRRPLGAATASAPRKLSPLKPTTATTRASPLKSSTTPLKSKAKEPIPTKPSPADQKIRKSTSLKGATSKKAEEVPPLSDATVSTNGGTKEIVTVEQNGSGSHQVDGSHQIVEQQDQQVLPVETVQASLLEF